MRTLQFTCLIVAFTTTAAYQITGNTLSAVPPEATTELEVNPALSSSFAVSSMPIARGPSLLRKEEADSDSLENDQARLEAAFDALDQQKARTEDSVQDHSPDPTPPKQNFSYLAYYAFAELPPDKKPADTVLETLNNIPIGTSDAFGVDQQARAEDSVQDHSSDLTPPEQNFSYLAYYVFAEIPPDKKPADTVLETLKDVPIGTPVEEIRRASSAFGVDFNFMKAVAKIESDFNPKQRTGSYIGLFQLSNYEFKQYGSGNITNPRDNAIAAAYKFATEALLFNSETGKKPTFSDLYLIHQQGWQGAAEHVSHPERVAWKSMCATDEGQEKGERWCKRAVWGNTLPAIKHIWKSVDKLTSGAFVAMWQQRVDHLYSRYAVAITEN
ncbi:MAG: transglycosylase SLT domain-containing protein [Sphingobacteriales bacterium]